MSFSKTVSVFAALASIFGASVAGYKLAKDSQPEETQKLDAKIEQLEQQLSDKTAQLQVPQTAQLQVPQVVPAPTQLPHTQPQTTPPPVTLPSPPVTLVPAPAPTPPPPPTSQ